MIEYLIDTEAMVRARDVELRQGVDRSLAMSDERATLLREAYRRTDEMVNASQIVPINLYNTLELK